MPKVVLAITDAQRLSLGYIFVTCLLLIGSFSFLCALGEINQGNLLLNRSLIRGRRNPRLEVNAENHFRAALGYDPGNFLAYDGLAKLDYLSGNYPEAINYWVEGLQRSPENRVLAYRLGYAWDMNGNHGQALSAWSQAQAEIRFTTEGKLYEEQGKIQLAKESYLLALEINPHWLPAQESYGEIVSDEFQNLFRDKQWEQAETNLLAALEIAPDFWRFHHQLGVVYLRQGQYREAEREILAGLQLKPGHDWSYATLGDIYMSQGRRMDAELAYREAIKLFTDKLENPWADHILIYKKIGDLYSAIKQWDDAVEAYQMTIQAGSTNKSLYAALGDAWCQIEFPQEAETAYREAIRLGQSSLRLQQSVEYISQTEKCPVP